MTDSPPAMGIKSGRVRVPVKRSRLYPSKDLKQTVQEKRRPLCPDGCPII